MTDSEDTRPVNTRVRTKPTMGRMKLPLYSENDLVVNIY